MAMKHYKLNSDIYCIHSIALFSSYDAMPTNAFSRHGDTFAHIWSCVYGHLTWSNSLLGLSFFSLKANLFSSEFSSTTLIFRIVLFRIFHRSQPEKTSARVCGCAGLCVFPIMSVWTWYVMDLWLETIPCCIYPVQFFDTMYYLFCRMFSSLVLQSCLSESL